jgi:hypothetical protein
MVSKLEMLDIDFLTGCHIEETETAVDERLVTQEWALSD